MHLLVSEILKSKTRNVEHGTWNVSLRRSTSCIIVKPIKADLDSAIMGFQNLYDIRVGLVYTYTGVIRPIFECWGLVFDSGHLLAILVG